MTTATKTRTANTADADHLAVGDSTSLSSSTTVSSNTLLIMVVDVSPLAWGERELQRHAQDKARAAVGKRSVGPAILNELLESIQAFGTAVMTLEPDAGLVIVGVSDNESAILFPRQDVLNDWLQHPDTYRPNLRQMRIDIVSGVSELLHIASEKSQSHSNASSRQAAVASAVSTSLCLINRFLVAARGGGGISALENPRYLNRDDDEGVVALIGSTNGTKPTKRGTKSAATWSPRILLLQASEDRSRDYNAMMNCAFAALKHHVVIDGCYLTAAASSSSSTSSSSHHKSSSAFLEQVCDLTGGVFLAPSGAAQVDGALTEILYSVFLAPLSCRSRLNLPTLNKVDFRARCFESGEMVDLAYVCNVCLSIFQKMPTAAKCPTCDATILQRLQTNSNDNGNGNDTTKKQRLTR